MYVHAYKYITKFFSSNFKQSEVLNNFRRIVQPANILCKLWFRGKIIGQESCEKTVLKSMLRVQKRIVEERL